jgi:CBS domain-containing protein
MLAQDIMTKDVATVRPDTALADAITIMLDHHVSGLPVVDRDNRLVGVLTEGDLLRRTETGTEPTHARWLDFILGPGRLAAQYVRTHGRQVENLMTQDVATVAPETPLAEIVQLMESKRIKRVPVMRGDTLVGVVSRADLLRPLARVLKQVSQPTSATDRQIHDAIVAEFAAHRWTPVNGIEVHVDEGSVVLEGTIFDNRDRAAMLVMARNVPGVKAVHDELVWVEPVSGASLGPTF